MAVPQGVSTEVWGLQDGSFKTAAGEGYTPDSDAVLWENGVDDWAGIGFIFNNHDLTDTWAADSLKIKINAPNGINELYLVFYDLDWNYAYYGLGGVSWDGTWKELSVALADFSLEGEVDFTKIYYFSVESYSVITERILIDDIWVGNPFIDFTVPPAPQNVQADVSTPYINQVGWDNIASETGETYDVYASLGPIENLTDPGVFLLEAGVPEDSESETVVAIHNIYYPLMDGQVSYHYAVICKDAAGNVSETFGATENAYTNTGKKRAIISLEESFDFTADGDLSEWAHIEPFVVVPILPNGTNWEGSDTESFTDSSDYTAKCYVAMDDTTLYVAFDVIDDVFSWTSGNESDWWNDESIEFYFGLYELGSPPHQGWQRGEEPDYRLVFKPDMLSYANGDEPDLYAEGSENYFFQPLGSQDYLIEARIPFAAIRAEGDAVFTPTEGSTIPFEIFAADADVADNNEVARVKFGDNPVLNPWGEGPDVWSFAWVGIPTLTAIGDQDLVTVSEYKLENNYPNPFNPTTTIEYSIANAGHVELYIYNTLGQRVATLVNENISAGHHQVTFDATGFASGVYFYKMVTADFSQVKKMLLVK
jgi:hypothetical protein